MKNRRFGKWFVWGFSVLAIAYAGIAMSAEVIKGRILGEKCAQMGKIGDCYLKWADPMVLWTEEGDYYHIELAGKTAREDNKGMKGMMKGMGGMMQPMMMEEECKPEDFCWQGQDLDRLALDKSFGQEVEVEGRIVDGERVQIARLFVPNPPGAKEFFKG